MPIYILTVRQQVKRICFVDAASASEARRIVRDEPEKAQWEGVEDIPDSKRTVMNCVTDDPRATPHREGE